MHLRSMCVVALGLASCARKAAEAPGAGASLSGADPRPGAPAGKPSPSLTESIEYWDGATRRKLWISPDLVAEFDPADAGRDAVLLADPSAQEVPQPQKRVRIWRTRAAAATRLSPVLHEGPSPGLPMRALPGGVVATFPPGWERERIDAWLAARGLRVKEAVDAASNMLLVDTPAGLESLRVADELHESGELVDASPNFWRQSSPR